MSLEMGAVDHDRPGGGAFPCQGLEDAVENPGLAPAHEAVVERLVGAVTGGRVAPHQPGSDDMDDTTDGLTVVDPWDAGIHFSDRMRVEESGAESLLSNV